MIVKPNLLMSLVYCLFFTTNLNAEEVKWVNHYLEANLDANYIFTGGDRLTNQNFFAAGFNIAHGTDITAVHALVLSYGKSYSKNGSGILTSKSFFLRRYMPKLSTSRFKSYSTIGSAAYSYELENGTNLIENAGIIIGFGSDWVYSKKLRFSVEADYRGFMTRQFSNNSTDFVRPVTLYFGLRYYYHSTKY